MIAFLQRRPSRPQLVESLRFPSLPFHWSDDPPPIPPSTERPRSSRIIRRVSTIFSPRKKQTRSANSRPVANIPVRNNGRRSNSCASDRTASTTSSDDIRPPSGLGCSVDISHSLPSNVPLPLATPSGDQVAVIGVPERMRCVSSPEMLRSNLALGKLLSISGRNTPVVPTTRDHVELLRRTVNMPPEVLDVILSFLPRATVASFAFVSKMFSSAARRKLYENLDTSALPADRHQRLTKLLASRWDIAGMVHTLVCDTWPPSPPPPSISNLSFLQPQVPLFSIALHNMHRLVSLTIPSFDAAVLRDRTNFRLKRLTILSRTMAPDEQTGLMIWLSTQPDITSLSFPNLVEPANVNKDLPVPPDSSPPTTASHPILNIPDPKSHKIPHHTHTRRRHSHHDILAISRMHSSDSSSLPLHLSPSLLPSLQSLHAPPTLTTLLAPARPQLTDVTIHIRTNLDTGLRPSALMSAIRHVKTLGMRFGTEVDRRSVEKVLRAAAAALGDVCQSLNIQIGWLVCDESLYKIVLSILPRFHVLHTLKLCRVPKVVTSNPSSPLSSSRGHDDALVGAGTNSMNAIAHGITMAGEEQEPESNTEMEEDETEPKNEDTAHLHEDERVHLELWLKDCAELRSVEFLSGRVWCAMEA